MKKQPRPSAVFMQVLLTSCMFLCVYLSRAVFGPLLPHIEREFVITHAASTRLLLYMSIGYSIGIFLSGFTATRVRPRVMAGCGVLGSGLVMLLIGETGQLESLAFLLVALGLVSGHYLNGGMAVMRDVASPSQWSMAVALHELGPTASFLFAPAAAEIGAAFFGWRFVIDAMAWACVAFGLLFLIVAKGGDAVARPLSFSGLRSLLKKPVFWLFAWLVGIGVAGEIAPYSVMVIYLTEERAFAPDAAAYLLSASRAASPFTVFLGGWLCKKIGSRRALTICLTSFAFSLFLLATPWNWVFLSGLFLQPTVAAMIFPPIFTILIENFAAKDQGSVLALAMPVGCLLGIGAVPALLGVCGDSLGFAFGFAALGATVAVTTPALRILRIKERR